MFEVSTILEDDSAEMSTGGANGFVNMSLLNSATSSLCGCSTFVELIGGEVVQLFGEIIGEGSSLSMVVEEGDLAISGGSRVVAELVVDTELGELIGGEIVLLFSEILREGASLSMVVEEGALAISGGSRVAAKLGVDTTLGGLKYLLNIG
nr:hypothetical protein [Tanacetum cinerariifolium]